MSARSSQLAACPGHGSGWKPGSVPHARSQSPPLTSVDGQPVQVGQRRVDVPEGDVRLAARAHQRRIASEQALIGRDRLDELGQFRNERDHQQRGHQQQLA